MRVSAIAGPDRSKWLWIVMAAALVMVFAGVWWAAHPGRGARKARETTPLARLLPRRNLLPAPPRTPPSVQAPIDVRGGAGPEPRTGADTPSHSVSVHITQPKAPADAACKPCASGKPVGVKPRPRDMFPVGPIAASVPQLLHPYRHVAEPFPSFAYGGKLWEFTGKFVSWRSIDPVPTGFALGDRSLYALANTSGPGSVLFLRTDSDPGKFAVYR